MALVKSSRGRFSSRLHFLARFTGLTGLAVAFVGLTIVLVDVALTGEIVEAAWKTLQGQEAAETPRLGILLLLGGLVAGLFALIVELLVMARVTAGRRGAFGFNAAVQVALATVLVVGVNLFSYRHYQRLDWTWDRKFTLSPELQRDLAKLEGETTIVVYQREKTFGRLSPKPDAYDYAANRKVVEKVKDLVEQFREFGPQFKVEVLDVEADDFGSQFNLLTRKLAEAAVRAKGELTESGPDGGNPAVERKTAEYRRRFRRAPENTIFFCSGDQVQHLPFSEFYQLDKTASRNTGEAKIRKGEEDEENENQAGSNLVLLYQGAEPFARKALNIDQRRPRVAIATIHELLSTEGLGEIGHHGLKKCLRENGFEVRDLLLKRDSPFSGGLIPAVYTYDEGRYETLEEQAAALDIEIKALEKGVEQARKYLKRWKTESLAELTKALGEQLEGQAVTEAMRHFQVNYWTRGVAALEQQINGHREERQTVLKEKAGLNVDRLEEQRRLQDLKAKLDRQLADVDLLILPRTTFLNATVGRRIGNQYHDLDKAQIASLRDYLKAGKPMLVCFGPINDEGRGPNASPTANPDGLEDLLTELGVRFGKSVVLFNVESKAFAAQRSGFRAAGLNIDVPSVDFDWPADSLWLPGILGQGDTTARPPHPLRHAMQIAQRSSGSRLDLPPHNPRPMGVDPELRKRLHFTPEIMVGSADSWNEANPFSTDQRLPHFEEPKDNDSRQNTLDLPRRGPFALGVALETTVPPSWYEEETKAKPARVRVAALGDGTLLVGRDLSPAREQLLLNTCNWLLGRDDALPRDDRPWSFPRVAMQPRERTLWTLAALIGLPGLFAYLGVVVLLVRRLR